MLFKWVLVLVIFRLNDAERLMTRLTRTPQLQNQKSPAEQPILSEIINSNGKIRKTNSALVSSSNQENEVTFATLVDGDEPISDFEISQIRNSCKPPAKCENENSIQSYLNNLVLPVNPPAGFPVTQQPQIVRVTPFSLPARSLKFITLGKTTTIKSAPVAKISIPTTTRPAAKSTGKVFYTTNILYQTTDLPETFGTEDYEALHATSANHRPRPKPAAAKTTVPVPNVGVSARQSPATKQPTQLNPFRNDFFQSTGFKQWQAVNPGNTANITLRNRFSQVNITSGANKPTVNAMPRHIGVPNIEHSGKVPANPAFINAFGISSGNAFDIYSNKKNEFGEVAFTSHNADVGSVVQTRYVVPSTYFSDERRVEHKYQFKETKMSSSSSSRHSTSVGVYPPYRTPSFSRMPNNDVGLLPSVNRNVYY